MQEEEEEEEASGIVAFEEIVKSSVFLYKGGLQDITGHPPVSRIFCHSQDIQLGINCMLF